MNHESLFLVTIKKMMVWCFSTYSITHGVCCRLKTVCLKEPEVPESRMF